MQDNTPQTQMYSALLAVGEVRGQQAALLDKVDIHHTEILGRLDKINESLLDHDKRITSNEAFRKALTWFSSGALSIGILLVGIANLVL